MSEELRAEVVPLVEHLFRRQASRLVALLTRIFGAQHIDLAEDVVQEALLRALRQWPFYGIPKDPVAWLLQSARNAALDVLRRDATFRDKEAQIREITAQRQSEVVNGAGSAGLESGFDDQLRLVFLCCHPSLDRDARVALTLKVACGFGVPEIARAFLAKEATIAQSLTRSKRKLRETRASFDLPSPEALASRIDSVLEVIYLLFNEGYASYQGEDLVRRDLVDEATRLATLLVSDPIARSPKSHALLALLLLQGARLTARVDPAGDLRLLEEQDRAQWDASLLQRGFAHLILAREGSELSSYHVEAGIAACHASAKSFDETDWRQILAFYDMLKTMNPSPVVSLNRAVAVAMVEGHDAGLAEIRALEGHPSMGRYRWLDAVRGELLLRSGRREDAAGSFRTALARAGSEPERRFLERKIDSCVDVSTR